MARAVLAAAFALVATAHAGLAAVIHVDVGGAGDHLTIQSGIDAASAGDTVLVAPGTYSGAGNTALDFGGTRLLLQASAGPATTIVDCGLATRAFNFHSGEDTTAVVRGFTITRGSASQGAGIYCAGASPLVESCWFLANSANSGGGAFCASSTARFRNCVFHGNTATYGSGVTILSSRAVLRSCTFCGNGGAGAQGTVYAVGTPSPVLRRCVMAFSAAGPPVSCVAGSLPQITRSIVFGNAGGDALCGSPSDNLFTDPLFCNMDATDLTVCANSPCVPGNNAWGQPVGALSSGCGSCSSQVSPTSWGRLKALYR